MIVNKPKKNKESSRYSVLYIIMFIIMGTIVGKLLYLQVYKYDDYKEKADVSSTKFISEEAPRGNIYDSNGNVIATNKQTYTLTYMETVDSTNLFFKTMDKVFQILEDNGEEFQDDLALKVDENGGIYFDFKTDNESSRRTLEVRFKRDRGLNEDIENKKFGNKEGDYTDEEINEVNDELMKISAEDTFYYLVKSYNLYKLLLPEDYTSEEANELAKKYKDATGKEILDDLLKEYSIQQIRRYIVVKDAIKIGSYSGYSNITIASNINRDTAFVVYQQLNDLPGINVSLKPVRYYTYGTLASAVVGYVSSISSSQQEVYELKGYDTSTDLIGVSGIESAFEEQLKGTKGGTTVKVNSQGRTTEELFKLESYPGNNVHLTIDKDVQYAAQEGLKDQILKLQSEGLTSATRGAVVAIEVNTGRVIAMASYPDFDPNDFAIPSELSTEKYNEYFNPDLESFGTQHIQSSGATGTLDQLFPDENEDGVREDKYDLYPRAMFNYATQAFVPPGSTFKPLTAVAALTEGAITEDFTVNDVGLWSNEYTGNQVLENFQKIGNGITDVRKALQVSSNYFFYETAIRLYEKNGANIDALNSIARYAWKFGLGVEGNKNASTGIQIYENFGQTYNFVSWRKRLASNAKYSIVPALEEGVYYGYSFVPFDISDVSTDSDELKELKTSLKNNIKETLLKVGTDEQITSQDEYAKSILSTIKKIMEVSDKYKENVAKYEADNNKKVDIDAQAKIVANAIAYFTVTNQTSEITSPINLVQDAIGQSMNTFTPLQMANYVATLANGGTRYKVSIVDKVTSPTGEVIQEFIPEVVESNPIDPEILQIVKEGMRRVNTSPSNGTAYELFGNFPIEVVGKTGTADFGTSEQYEFQGRKAYANYISFAPMDNPQIAIFSTIYDGNRGGNSAYVHKGIYEAFFKDELLTINPNYASTSETFQKYVVEAPADNNQEAEEESQQQEAEGEVQEEQTQETE
ncbi:penicillin-binding transpeptidase domain-containing protein [uncultured Clostridium sp.]|uniref:penicillin-binding transpeptidase domain-containing protein n=1 Tax=uncultured Clostridium sp. TaxID=59620 RepID=UPI0025F90FFC|nr:penicillin-binding transpeptidase domain-containing protein [uncultured Clostridium sp.]MDU4882758.1 penicillin-binding transpeptidase domain-containing protein [Clostridium celatum]MDU7075972.1 penicillin-binding transpeptidase domain-containing protein [Clostridium celatum]